MTDQTPASPDIQQQVERNSRFNFTVNALDGMNYWFGMSFISATVILPLFVSHFTSNPLLIGLIPFFNTAGFLVPQIFTSNWVERAPRKKFFPVTLGFFLERVPVFLMAPAAYFLSLRQPGWALFSFFFLIAWQTFGAGFILVGWQDMIAKVIPVEMRGRFFGITNFVGNGAGVLGALVVPILLQRFRFPDGYALSFGAAGVMTLFSWFFLSLTREPSVPSTKPVVSQLDYFRSLPAILRRDANFRMYLLSQIVFSISCMAGGFFVVYAVKTWSLPDSTAGSYSIILQVGLALANLFFGFLADRKGHKLGLEICMLLNTASLVLAIVSPSPWWFFPMFFIRGAMNAVNFISGISIIMEFSSPEDRPTYIGLANTIPGIAGGIAPLLGGWLAGAVSYRAMFILSTVISLASWAILHFMVREPRTHKADEPLPRAEIPPLP